MFVKNVFDHSAELKHIVGSRGIDDRDCRREVLMLPVAVGGDGGSELGSGELARPSAWYFTAIAKTLACSMRKLFPEGGGELRTVPDVWSES